MSALYRPVLIESVEQAEALPARTLIGTGGLSGSWITLTYPEDAEWGPDDLPFRALVPIEAEEETREHPRRHEKAPRAGEAYLRPATMTRLVTPWEEA